MQLLSFNPATTKAILIGVGEYDHLPQIQPAVNNIDDIEALFLDSEFIGMPKENVITIVNKRNDEINDCILDFLSDEENIDIETLIIYYVGHGIREANSRELYLTGKNSKSATVRTSAIPYTDLKQLIENSHIQNRIVVLDACHSGLATMDAEGQPYSPTEIDIKGSYTLTSAAGNEKAFFDSSQRNTFFTAELLKTLKNGLPKPVPAISLENLFTHLKGSIKQSSPQRKSNLNVPDFYFSKNIQYDAVKWLEKDGDDLFARDEYQQALVKYLTVYNKKPSPEIQAKIDECEKCIAMEEKIRQKHARLDERVATATPELAKNTVAPASPSERTEKETSNTEIVEELALPITSTEKRDLNDTQEALDNDGDGEQAEPAGKIPSAIGILLWIAAVGLGIFLVMGLVSGIPTIAFYGAVAAFAAIIIFQTLRRKAVHDPNIGNIQPESNEGKSIEQSPRRKMVARIAAPAFLFFGINFFKALLWSSLREIWKGGYEVYYRDNLHTIMGAIIFSIWVMMFVVRKILGVPRQPVIVAGKISTWKLIGIFTSSSALSYALLTVDLWRKGYLPTIYILAAFTILTIIIAVTRIWWYKRKYAEQN